jgi:hypothetical protein
MAVICAECRTGNRDGAKFCRGCGRRLAAIVSAPIRPAEEPEDDWPETQRMSMHSVLEMPRSPATAISASVAPARSDRKSAVAATRRKPLAPLPPPVPSSFRGVRSAAPKGVPRTASAVAARKSNALFVGALGLSIAAFVLAIGGWYAYNARHSVTATESPAAAVPAAEVAPPTAAPPALEPAQAVTVVPPPVEAPAIQPPAAKPLAATAPKAKKTATAPIQPLPQAAVVAPPPAPTPAPEPVAPPSPQTACAGLNFFARAQCMAAQCAKPDNKAHAQCEAVRRQQQIDEEKRNPSLLN